MSTTAAGHEVSTSGDASAAAPAWLDGGRIPSLDGIRATAIFLVLFSHQAMPTGFSLPELQWRCGHLGVQLFFVLSGFLITTLMVREIQRTGRLNLKEFYVRRCLRILPVYGVYLIAIGILQAWGQVSLSGQNWIALTTYTVNFLFPVPTSPHVWSLSVEEHFYLVWPLVMVALAGAPGRKTVLLTILAAVGLRWSWLMREGLTPSDEYWYWTITRMDDLAIGCMLAFLVRDRTWRSRLDQLTRGDLGFAALFGTLLVAQVACSSFVGRRFLPSSGAALLVALSNNVNAVLMAVFVWAATSQPCSRVGRILNHRLLATVGVLSYSLYLWHMLFFKGPFPALRCFPFSLICSFVVAGISYQLVEKPFLALKGKLESSRMRRSLRQTPAESQADEAWQAPPLLPSSAAR